MNEALSIGEAEKRLADARLRYESAHAKYEEARKDETNAMNGLNAAEREFDAAVEALKQSAPWNSDWHTARNRTKAAGDR